MKSSTIIPCHVIADEDTKDERESHMPPEIPRLTDRPATSHLFASLTKFMS